MQNFEQWGMFLNMMEQMQARRSTDRSDPGANMKELFHGTEQPVVEQIVEHNFNRSFNRVGAYGTGVYFARDAKYSASPRYARPNAAGQQFMILTKVLVGHSTTGHKGMLQPPERQDGSGRRYDSLESAGGEIVVSCKDFQAYAEHVITFTQKCGQPLSARVVQQHQAFRQPFPRSAVRALCRPDSRFFLTLPPLFHCMVKPSKAKLLDQLELFPCVFCVRLFCARRYLLKVVTYARLQQTPAPNVIALGRLNRVRPAPPLRS